MIELTVNNQSVTIPDGGTILDAVRAAGAELPTLCHHDGLEPYGACRLCLVAVTHPRNTLAAACVHPAEAGMVIDTEAPQAVQARRLTLEFLLARAPGSELIKNLAARAGIESSRFESPPGVDEQEKCILCGLCVRVCREAIGASAIEFIGRGENRKVGAPFDLQAEACIGCGACAEVCPTGAVKIEDRGGLRILHTWHTQVKLERCSGCGSYFAPQPMKFMKEMYPETDRLWGLCPVCRSKQAGLLVEVKPVVGRED